MGSADEAWRAVGGAARAIVDAGTASAGPPPSTTGRPPVVYVFDLDESLVLMDSLRSGAYAAAVGTDPAPSILVGQKLASAVLEVADLRLSFATLEKACAPPATLADAVALPPPAGPAYAAVADAIEEGGRRGVLTQDQAVRAAGLRTAADGLTRGWLAAAGRLLAGLEEAGGATARAPAASTTTRPVKLALVSAGHLLPSIAKLHVFGLSAFLPSSAVVSSRSFANGKAGAFARLAEEHGAGATFVVIGDGPDEEAAARARGWAFVRVGPVAAGGEFGGGGGGGGGGLKPDALGRQTTPIPRLTVLDLRRAAGLV